MDGGGCSGFSYVFEIDTNELNPDQDCVYTAYNGAQLVLDDMTLEYVQGATIDYIQEMIKVRFLDFLALSRVMPSSSLSPPLFNLC